jgi:Fur family ferric uptake transcriptional regulator
VGERGNGFRMTRARAAILDVLERGRSHPTAEELHRSVRRRADGVSLATVYRGLEALVREGRVRVVEMQGAPRRFDAVTDRHYHAVCARCGRVGDVELRLSAPLESAVAGLGGFRVTGHQLCFTGLCPDCVGGRGKARETHAGRRGRWASREPRPRRTS